MEKLNETTDTRLSGQVLPRWVVVSAFVLLLTLQLGFSFQGLGNYWQWGHNGYNSAAYQQAARNTLRWDLLFPAQYTTGNHKPSDKELYTHAPLALHFHTTASVAIFGDSEAAVRFVPAIHGVLAMVMMFILVRRHWGDLAAIVATLLYVLMPINHAFANMSNHVTGSLFWGLVALYCYLEWKAHPGRGPPKGTGFKAGGWHWCVGIFAGFFMAFFWDWPPYYVAFIVAWHWLYTSFDAEHRDLPRRFGLNREHLVLTLFCLFVLINFFGFFWLVYNQAGGFEEMKASFNLRSTPPADAYGRLWRESLNPMFSAPMLLLGVAWTFLRLMRHARGEPIGRDLIPLCYGFGGVLHIALYKSTALVHIYWSWQLNVFLAIAATSLALSVVHIVRGWSVRRWERRPRLAAAFAAILILVPLCGGFALYSAPLFVEGRRVAGTFNHAGYKTEQLKVLFSQKVAQWTTFDTGILMLRSFRHRIEVLATLDRVNGWTSRVDRIYPPKNVKPKDGWVAVGPVSGTQRRQLLKAAAKHPFRQYGLYFMVDTRTKGRDIQIWNLVPNHEPGFIWRFWNSYNEPKMEPERDAKAEAQMLKEIEALPKAKPARKPLKAIPSKKKTTPTKAEKPLQKTEKPSAPK